MNARVVAVRAPFLAALALILGFLLARSSLAIMLPFEVAGVVWLWIMMGCGIALLPALLARQTPVPSAAFVVVPILAASAYGASRLDWLRVLKDFGVAEADAVDFARLALAALAMALLWALHVVDIAARSRAHALERGIERAQADAAAQRALTAGTKAGAVALAGAAGLLAVALVGLRVGAAVPTERGAFIVPLIAAALLVGTALWLARAERA